MSTLVQILAMISADQITGAQTVVIDRELCRCNPDDIRVDQRLQVIEYIDMQLAHNEVSGDTRRELIRLHDQLSQRHCKVD